MSIQSEINRLTNNVSDALTAIAAKGVTVPPGSTSDDLADLIGSIQQGGGSAITVTDTPNAAGGTTRAITAVSLVGDTVSAATLLDGETAHDQFGNPIVGEYTGPTPVELATPQISVNSSTGLITATVTQSAGYVSSGAKSNTSQLTVQTAKTVTPTTSSQTAVDAGRYTTGAVTVSAMPTGTAGTPTATKGTVTNHAVNVTPSVTNTTGYITGDTKTGTAVSVSASELVSGSQTITQNGTVDVTNLASVVVNVSGGGSGKAFYSYDNYASRTANSYGATTCAVTVTKAGTYNIVYGAWRGSSSGTMGTNVHIGDTAGTNHQTWTGTYGKVVVLTNQTIAANTNVTLYATSGSTTRTIYVGPLYVYEV